jgi:hypothetical protein
MIEIILQGFFTASQRRTGHPQNTKLKADPGSLCGKKERGAKAPRFIAI